MKKILLASTALVLSAGIAQAQGLSIGGQGRMGVNYISVTGSPSATTLHNRFRLNLSATIQGDNGLTFGAFGRIQTTGGSTAGMSGSNVWVEANGLRLTVGNVAGAIANRAFTGCSLGYMGGTNWGGVGGDALVCGDSAGLVETMQDFTSGGAGQNGGQRARVDYTFADFGVSVSHDRNRSTEIAANYSFDGFTVRAGYRNESNASADLIDRRIVTLSAGYNAGNWGVNALFARIGGGTIAHFNNYTLSGHVEVGGGTARAYVGRQFDGRTYGLAYAYGLGGGANLVGSIERASEGGIRANSATVGVVFNF